MWITKILKNEKMKQINTPKKNLTKKYRSPESLRGKASKKKGDRFQRQWMQELSIFPGSAELPKGVEVLDGRLCNEFPDIRIECRRRKGIAVIGWIKKAFIKHKRETMLIIALPNQDHLDAKWVIPAWMGMQLLKDRHKLKRIPLLPKRKFPMMESY